MKKAFTLVEILIVVAIIGLLAAIGIPSFIGARQGAEDNMKQVNISAVNAAKDQWAIMNNKAAGTAVVWTNISAYMGNSVTSQSDLAIPKGSTHTINLNAVGTSATYN